MKKTPLSLQVNPIECGAVALGIVLEYYGQKIPRQKLHELVGVSPRGSSADNIIKAARTFGFKAEGKRGVVDDLKGHELAILFFDNCHFVVFEGTRFGRFYINDPALGRYVISRKHLRERFSGVLISLIPPKKNKSKKVPLKTLSTQMVIFFWGMGIGWLLSMIALIVGFIALNGPSSLLLCITALLVIFIIISLVWQNNRLFIASNQIKLDHLIENIKKVRPSFFYVRPFTRFSMAIEHLTKPRLDPQLKSWFYAGIFLCLLLVQATISWPLALLLLILAGLIITLKPRRLSFDSTKLAMKESLLQSWVNYPDLDAMGQNSFLYNKQMDYELKLAHFFDRQESKIISSFVYVLLWLFFLALFYLANLSLYGFIASLEEVAASIILGISIFYSASLFVSKEDNIFLYTGSFIKELEEQAHVKTNNKQDNTNTVVSINNGFFTYAGDEKPVLAFINLTVFPGKLYGVMGPPRAGSSTLLKLLAQKMPWQKGQINFNAEKWALIDDDAELFSGTLWDNITLFDKRITEQEVANALYDACIEELFLRRPMGLLTSIESRGNNLSMGQKKRLLLARALVHKPQLLMLDDFFDTLDQELALRMIAKLKKANAAIIFTSWRAEELAQCDSVLMLSQQKILAQGTHEELVNNAQYFELIGAPKRFI